MRLGWLSPPCASPPRGMRVFLLLQLCVVSALVAAPAHLAGWRSSARVATSHRPRAAPHLGVKWLRNGHSIRRKTKRPKRIILVRHGQSEGNADATAYASTPDSQIALTERGFAQGAVAGLQIRKLVGDETVRFFYSPYLRAQQTMLAILQAFDGQTVHISSEPRLREQDFGNFQDPEKMNRVFVERQKFGRFYYRFPNGEAGTDVFDRMASFITYLFRTMTDSGYYEGRDSAGPAENYVVITHGLLMRIFCMCYLRWTVTEFEQVWNPSNCEIWVLELIPGSPKYQLAGRWRATPIRGAFTDIKFGKNRNEPLFDHMKRPLTSRAVTPGTPCALLSDELAHLSDLPGPRKTARSYGRNNAMLAGDAVLRYWSRDSKDVGKGGDAPPPAAGLERREGEARGAAAPDADAHAKDAQPNLPDKQASDALSL